jgi:hypothetical protein
MKWLNLVIAFLLVAVGGYVAWQHFGSSGSGGGSMTYSTTTTTLYVLPVPPASTTTTQPAYSLACSNALAGATPVADKLANHQPLTASDAKTLSASLAKARTACTSTQYMDFVTTRIQPYTTP